MNSGRTVFSQLIGFLPDREFRRCVHRYHGDRRLREFSCWDQYLTMAFAQLTYRESLRDIEACLRSLHGKLYHLGFRSRVARSTLADANESRDWRIFVDFAQVLIGIARPLYAHDPLGVDLDQSLYALDSTTIDLCLSLFPWARFRQHKSAVKLHTLLDLRGNIPTFLHVTEGAMHDVNLLDELLPEAGAFYVMDRAYLDFERFFLFTLCSGGRLLRELSRSYLTLVQDTTRVMNRLEAIYRSRGLRASGRRVYSLRSRAEYLEQLTERGARHRARLLYQQLNGLLTLRREARQALLAENRKHPAHRVLLSIPGLGPIRVALLLARIHTPHRFRTKRQLWAYAGLGLVTHSSADYHVVDGRLERTRQAIAVRGVNWNHNHALKEIFKSAALRASRLPGPWREFFTSRVAQGMRPELARLTLARKLAALTLNLWKKGERYDIQKLSAPAA